MPSIIIKRVENRKQLKTFVDFHYDLYKGNPYDVPNLFADEMNTLDKEKNAAFDFCEAEYYLAYKEDRLVGRVAAIVNYRPTSGGTASRCASDGLTSWTTERCPARCSQLSRTSGARRVWTR